MYSPVFHYPILESIVQYIALYRFRLNARPTATALCKALDGSFTLVGLSVVDESVRPPPFAGLLEGWFFPILEVPYTQCLKILMPTNMLFNSSGTRNRLELVGLKTLCSFKGSFQREP